MLRTKQVIHFSCPNVCEFRIRGGQWDTGIQIRKEEENYANSSVLYVWLSQINSVSQIDDKAYGYLFDIFLL